MADRLTLQDFYRTGQQDAANVFGMDEVREALREHPQFTDQQLLADILEHTYDVHAPATKAAWIADQDFEGLDPQRAWDAYQRGWADVALGYIRDWRPRLAREALKHNPAPRRHRKDSMRRPNPDDDFDDAIKDGMARAIWVTSFADWVQKLPRQQQRELGAGQGGDWNDAAGETPRSAIEAAQALIDLYERTNGPIGALFLVAAQADKRKPTDRLADLFGHALAMQALGTGVAWTDDHRPFPLKRVDFEAWLDAPDDDRDRWRVDWSPRSMANPAGRFTNAQMVAMQDAVHAQNRRGLDHQLTEHMLEVLKGAADFADIQDRLAALNRRRTLTNAQIKTLERILPELRRVSAAALTSNWPGRSRPRHRGAR